jgi:predicted regulator of Ras-like GTPase activity (Roadblock/LC7/MglB family)
VGVEETLKALKEVRGVRAVALLTEDGFVVESLLDEGAPALDRLGAASATALATARGLSQELRRGEVEEVMVEYPDGVLLLVPLAGHQLVLYLDSVASLGRTRLELKRALPRLKEAL